MKHALASLVMVALLVSPAFGQTLPPEEVLKVLRAGGYVIVVRHGATHADQADTDPLNLDNVAKQRQLNDKGRADARALGELFKAASVPIGTSYSSRFFRAVETARLIGGKEPQATPDVSEGGLVVSPNENNRRTAALRALVGAAPEPGTNTLIVTHKPNILDAFGRDWFEIKEGEASIFKPSSARRRRYVHAGRSGPDQPVGDVEVAERWSGAGSAGPTCVASVLGFGGSEIGYERASVRTVERLLGERARRRPQRRRHGRVLRGQRGADRQGHRRAPPRGPSVHQVRSRRRLEPRRLAAEVAADQHRAQPASACAPTTSTSSSSTAARSPSCARATSLRRWSRRASAGWARYIGYSGDGEAARYAVECGRFDTLQTSVSMADQHVIEQTLPLARARDVGVIAKRPLANVAWRYARKPSEPYYQTYWSRLRRLDYTFLRDLPDIAVGTALRFTLSVPGVHTAIVGTRQPERWQQNAALLAAGALPPTSSSGSDRDGARLRTTPGMVRFEGP